MPMFRIITASPALTSSSPGIFDRVQVMDGEGNTLFDSQPTTGLARLKEIQAQLKDAMDDLVGTYSRLTTVQWAPGVNVSKSVAQALVDIKKHIEASETRQYLVTRTWKVRAKSPEEAKGLYSSYQSDEVIVQEIRS